MRRNSEEFAKRKAARRQLFALVPKIAPALTWGVLVATFVAGIMPTFFTIVSGALVGAVPEAISGNLDALTVPLAATAILIAVQQLLGPIRSVLTDALGRRINGRLRAKVMAACALPPSIAHLEDSEWLDKVEDARGVGTGMWKPGDAVTGFANTSTRKITGFAAAVLLARYSPILGLLLTVSWLVIIRRWKLLFFDIVETFTGETGDLRRAKYVRDLALAPHAAKETRVFGLARWVVDRYRRVARAAYEMVWATRDAGWKALGWCIPLVAVTHSIALALIARDAAAGVLSIGELTVYVGAVFGIVDGFANLNDDELRIEFGAASVPPMLALEEMGARVAAEMSGDSPTEGAPHHSIRFEGVSFSYPGRDTQVYKGLDLEIEAGKSLAIVGSNGAGKTTLVKLLARLYDPDSGRITVDGVDLRELDPTAWQRRVAAVFQDFVRYELSVRDNVGFGAFERRDDQELLDSAAQRAGATKIISDLGWDTVLSRRYEGGAEPSGGQWQRIAIARAMAAAAHGAGVLVLDEPTANLDVRAEAEIYDRFFELTAELTTLVISHRFSTVRRAERIVVIEHGVVVEDGTHEELMAQAGRYARMFNLQAERFEEVEL